MTDDVRRPVPGVIAAGVSAAVGRLAGTCLWRRRVRRKHTEWPKRPSCLRQEELEVKQTLTEVRPDHTDVDAHA